MPNCLACGHGQSELWAMGRDEEYFTTPDRFEYRRCLNCSALFIDPVPRDRLAEIYPPSYYSYDDKTTSSWVFQLKDWLDGRFFKSFISKLPQDRLRVLDIGGGSGQQLSSLRRADQRISETLIVDLDQHAGDAARAAGHEYFCGRFEDYPGTVPFDVILMLNLIEHVDDPSGMLEKACELLSGDGIIVIKTPNTEALDARLFRHRNWGGYHCPRHWVLFNLENLTRIAVESGLEVKRAGYTQGAPFWTTSVLFALTRRGWIHTSAEHPVPQHVLYLPLNVLFAGVDMARGLFWKTSQMFLVLKRRDDGDQ